ncbi:MAG: prepilin-type N-terminal cleavage/methylation domain-containing protein [Gemmatimonadota bacterium]|nr:MAG: prepilin-type N-terminal cleavage/methylation domain-containing protein [Gemmatimonadota bacterium]
MRNKGFTIAELIIVLVMAGIVMAIISPSLSRAFRRTGVRAAVDEFSSTHSLARSAAVRFGRMAELHIDTIGMSFWVEVDTSSAGGVKDTVGVVKYQQGNDVTIESTRGLLCFDARGLPTTRGACEAPDARLIFTSGSREDTINITALGRVLR